MARFTVSDIAKITALLICTVCLFLANGLQATLVPVRAEAEGFSTFALGWLGTIYFIGFVVGCICAPRMLSAIGHVRTFAILAAVAAATVLVHAMRVDVMTWSALRAVMGFCGAGMYAIVEGWLNHQAVNAIRGRVFTTYATLNALALIGGNTLFAQGDPRSHLMFTWVAMLTLACLIPICLTRQTEPTRPKRLQIRILKLARLSPAGFAGAITTGLAGGAFWSLALSFAQARGLDQSGVATFMVVVILGGAMAQWPLGRMSDFMDRRIVIMLAASGTILASLGLAFAQQTGGAVWIVLFSSAWLFGAMSFPIGSLANAHLNDRAHADDISETASGILLTSGVASAIGTMLGASAMSAIGPSGLFAYTALVHLGYLTFVVTRMIQRRPAEHDTRASATPRPAAALAQAATPPPKS